MANDVLVHYGVLGMKWGIRKADKKGTSYTYKSHYTKKHEKKSKDNNVEKAKRDVHKQKAKYGAEFDKKMQDQVANTSGSKTAAKVVLTGLTGAKAYESSKAAGYSKLMSIGITTVGTILAGPLGTTAVTSINRRDYVYKKTR